MKQINRHILLVITNYYAKDNVFKIGLISNFFIPKKTPFHLKYFYRLLRFLVSVINEKFVTIFIIVTFLSRFLWYQFRILLFLTLKKHPFTQDYFID